MYAGERSTKAAAARDLSGWCIGVLVLGGGGGVLSGWAQVDNISVKLMALRSTKAVGTAAALVIARPLSSIAAASSEQHAGFASRRWPSTACTFCFSDTFCLR